MPEVTTRMRLARAALEAALSVDGVIRPDTGPADLLASHGGGERVPGAVASAGARGRVDVDLHLVVRAVPLEELAQRIRALVRHRADAASLGAALGAVNVRFADVETEADAGAGAGAGARRDGRR